MTTMMSMTMTAVQEYDAIVKTIQQYIAGGRSGKGTEMKPAFHPDATIFGYVGSDLFAGLIQGLFNDKNGPAAEMQARVDVAGTIATARLEIDNWTGHRFNWPESIILTFFRSHSDRHLTYGERR